MKGGGDARWGNGRKRQAECFVFKGSRPSHVEGGWKLYFELYKDWKETMIRVTAFHSPPRLLKVKVPLGRKSDMSASKIVATKSWWQQLLC